MEGFRGCAGSGRMIRAAKPVAKRTSPVTTKVPLKPQESAIHDPKSGATDLAPDRIEVSKPNTAPSEPLSE